MGGLRGATRAWVWSVLVGLGLGLAPACRREAQPPARAVTPARVTPASVGQATPAQPSVAEPVEPEPRDLRRCFSQDPAWVDAPVADLLDRAAALFDEHDYIGALACAEE